MASLYQEGRRLVTVLVGALAASACLTQNAGQTLEAQDVDSSSAADTSPSSQPDVPDEIDVPLPEVLPCILVSPEIVSFGGVPVGSRGSRTVTVASCSPVPLELLSIQLEGDPGFELELGPLQVPGVIPPGGSVAFDVAFAPVVGSPVGPGGVSVPSEATVQITSSAAGPATQVELQGVGVGEGCPTAVIQVLEGQQVEVGTLLHLDGTESSGGPLVIVNYAWSVVQPPGSQEAFLPSAAAPEPVFMAAVAGVYVFRLETRDELGRRSCEAAEYIVTVLPSTLGLRIELTWDTPGDEDQTDEGPGVGADLDLHLLHPFATGRDIDGDGIPDGWFDMPWDCFWLNANPPWGIPDPLSEDGPVLERQDTDGAGPEVIELRKPQDGLVYRVGVHGWDMHGFGHSFATVRVFVRGKLAYESGPVELDSQEFWDALTIVWPSGEVAPLVDADGEPRVVPGVTF